MFLLNKREDTTSDEKENALRRKEFHFIKFSYRQYEFVNFFILPNQ